MAHILRSDPFVAEVSFNTICSKMWFQKVLKALSHLLLILGCFVHFLPPNLPKYSSNDLKFSWRCFFDELRKLLKNHWIMFALVVLPQRANVWKVFKKAHFWPFFGIFYPLTSANVVQKTCSFQEELVFDEFYLMFKNHDDSTIFAFVALPQNFFNFQVKFTPPPLPQKSDACVPGVSFLIFTNTLFWG